MTSHAAAERQALVEALRAAGPEAPTLCAGWTARDLAAHLVARERRPDAAAGIAVPWLRGWGERVRKAFATKPFDTLVELIAGGPPHTSGFALPGVDASLNLTEHFVHCEDVRRGRSGWQPRELDPDLNRALWRVLCARGRFFFRDSPVGVTVRTPDGQSQVVRDGEPMVTLTGAPGELTLYAFGRAGHALVSFDGPQDAIRRLRDVHLRV